jgi:hypothetical protein
VDVRRAIVIGPATLTAAALLGWGRRRFGATSARFGFLAVWVPMMWLGTISRVAQPRLPGWYHRLRPWEHDGVVYERLGVTAAKRLLRRGPLAVFNPQLHLPAERTPEQLARLEQKMEDAEASHVILLCATLGLAIYGAKRGRWRFVGSLLLADAAMNGYPVMLQRYNRTLLARRFGEAAAPDVRHPLDPAIVGGRGGT